MEYFYLLAAAALAAVLAARMKDLAPIEIVMLIGGIFILGFMYSFRKMQRLRIKKMEENNPHKNIKDKK